MQAVGADGSAEEVRFRHRRLNEIGSGAWSLPVCNHTRVMGTFYRVIRCVRGRAARRMSATAPRPMQYCTDRTLERPLGPIGCTGQSRAQCDSPRQMTACRGMIGCCLQSMQDMYELPETGFLRLSQVLSVIPLGKTCWWEGVKSGRFPKPVKLSARCTAWRAEDIHELIRTLSDQSARN